MIRYRCIDMGAMYALDLYAPLLKDGCEMEMPQAADSLFCPAEVASVS